MPTEIKNKNWKNLFAKQNSKTSTNTINPSLIDSYYFIYDCDVNKISFINSAFTTITGYNAETFDIDELINIMHPEDQSYFFDCEAKDLEFKNTLSYNQHFQYLYTYTYRIQIKSQDYIYIKQTCQALEVNNRGDLTKTLVIHQIIDNYEIREPNDHKIFDKTRNIYLNTENCYKLTRRELEILKLVQDGLNSIEIAEKLFTSKYTIDTHRKNILKKTNSINFIELLRKLSLS